MSLKRAVSNSIDNKVNIQNSSSISLSFHDVTNNTEISVSSADQEKKFEFYIKRSVDFTPEFGIINSSNIKFPSHNQLFLQNLRLNGQNVSFHMHIMPTNTEVGFLAVLRYEDYPVLSKGVKYFDDWKVFCPKGKEFLLNSDFFFKFWVFL